MTIRYVLFDLDGTIIDSEKAAFEAILKAFSKWSAVVDAADAALIAGRKWEIAFDHLFSKYRVPLPRPEAERAIKEQYRLELESHLPVVPGSPEAIRALAKEFPLALVSGSDREDVVWALEKLGVLGCFQHVLGAEDYEESKPSPAGFSRAIRLLGEKPEHGVAFEDSEAGIAAALAAGLRVVAVTSTNHFALKLDRAHHRIPNFLGIDAEWIRKLR